MFLRKKRRSIIITLFHKFVRMKEHIFKAKTRLFLEKNYDSASRILVFNFVLCELY